MNYEWNFIEHALWIVDVAYDNKVFDRKYQCHFFCQTLKFKIKTGKYFVWFYLWSIDKIEIPIVL
jgi:hypothetical protein